MTPRLALLSTVVVLAAAPALAVNLPCLNVDPCVINSSSTIPAGLYDIRPRSLVIGNKQITISGAGEFKVLANNVTFQPGARIIADSSVNLMTVTLDAAGTMDLQSQGTSKSKIDVSGSDAGGNINLTSVGNLSINGTLISNATTTFGFGGSIAIKSTTGNVTITGDPSEGIRSFGNAQGGGGAIAVEATLGSIAISTQIVPKGGDCGTCSVDLFAGTNVTTTAQGVMDLRASGAGDGGSFSATAAGDINLAGNILANGSSDDTDGGSGGDVEIDANGSVTVAGRVEVNGAGQDAAPGSTNGSVDGDGGTVDVSAGTFVTVTGAMFGVSKGFGLSDEFSLDAVTDLTLGGEMDISGDNFGGDITGTADGSITVSARLKSATPIDPVNKPDAFAGTIDLEACQINVTATGELICTGPGGDPTGSNDLVAGGAISIAGTMTATAVNEFDYRATPPVITGTVVPAPSLFLMPAIPCCGPACPTTTTSTSTTSTTSTSSSSSSTSTSTAIIPTTSSSTVVIPTTSSSTVVPTTSSSSTVVPTTVIGTTSSSSTHAPTTSSTSSTSPASSTTTSTAAPTTSSTSTTQPGATTTSSSTLASTTSTLGTTTSTHATTTSTSTLGSTTSTLGTSTSTSTLGSSTSTLATTTSTSSLASSTSTAAPTTSTTSVATSSSTSTLPGTPTTSTTLPLPSCLDTALGIDAVRCSLDQMSTLIGQATEDELGGHKLSKQLAARVSKATAMVTDPQTTKKLKKASRVLKGFSNQLTHGLVKRKTPIDPELGAELGTLVGEARGELAGLGF
jgi:hypothetical protein